MDGNCGVITEQGDLGLGFNPVSKEDADKIKESTVSGTYTEPDDE